MDKIMRDLTLHGYCLKPNRFDKVLDEDYVLKVRRV